MNTQSKLLAVLCAVWCTAAFMGCDTGFHDSEPAGRKGAVRVIIGADDPARTDSRTAVPANPDFVYTLTFTAPGKPDVTAEFEGSAGQVFLDAGTWTLSVIGKTWGDAAAESDSIPVTVPPEGDPITVSVIMHPLLNGEDGIFRYRINASGAITDVSAALTPLDVGDADQDETALTIGEWFGYILSVAPGYYRLTVRAMKGSQTLIRREIVHIYSHTETEKTYDLTEDDFAPAVILAGTLTGGLAGYTPSGVVAYENADCRLDIGEGTADGDAWTVEAEGTPETVWFKVRLSKGGGTAAYYSKPVTVSGLSALGKADIVLAIEGYAITFDANGGTFAGGGDTVSMTAPENETLTPPPAPQGGREFTGWFGAGRSFTSETPITGDIIVYAGWAVGLGDIADYLANAPGGDTAAVSVPLTLNENLAGAGWENILAVIDAAGKYATLDLSACTMGGTEFDPGIGLDGVDKVAGLILPDAAQSIKPGARNSPLFPGYTSLKSLSGEGVKTVDAYAFYHCDSLESVSLPAATYIGKWAFYECVSLKSMSLPAATYIDGGAFYHCDSLKSMSLPAATYIGDHAFSSCESLASVSLPAAQTIDGGAFSNCVSLESVSLPAAQTIDGGAFSNCVSLESVSLPAAQTIGGTRLSPAPYAFAGCTSLKSVDLPAATYIGYKAFYECRSLESVSLPAAQIIGDSAFEECGSLVSVNLPASLMIIGDGAFIGCGKLTTITVDPANPAFTARDGMLMDKAETTLIAYPSATGAITLPDIIDIGASAFYSCGSLVSVSLPAAQTIGGAAFGYCGSLESVSLPAAQTIGDSAFYNSGGAFYYCKSLVSVDLPAVQTIGGGAFSNCTSLVSVDLPAVETIGNGVFRYCESLKSVSLPAAQTIDYEAFYECRSLESVDMSSAVSIGNRAFFYCKNLRSVDLPAAQTIGYRAFIYCESLVSVYTPAVETIGNEAFYGCRIESVNLPAATYIGDSAFNSCGSLTSVSLPAATSIGDDAFAYCGSLESVSLPAATSIGNEAFRYCYNLESVSLPATPPSMGSSIFYETYFDGSSGTITVSVPTGAVSAYTSAWGVDASTPSGGNTIYGDNHKAVLITDAAQ